MCYVRNSGLTIINIALNDNYEIMIIFINFYKFVTHYLSKKSLNISNFKKL